MKTSSIWNFRSIGGKLMLGLVLAAMFGGISVASSFGDDDHGRRERDDRDRYEHRERGHDRDRYYRGRRENRREYSDRERVYVPPPVIYEPPPPPGIGIFLPGIHIRL